MTTKAELREALRALRDTQVALLAGSCDRRVLAARDAALLAATAILARPRVVVGYKLRRGDGGLTWWRPNAAHTIGTCRSMARASHRVNGGKLYRLVVR